MTTSLPKPIRHKRNPLPTILGLIAVLGLCAVILFGNVGKNLEYFVTPTEYQQQQQQLQGRAIRIGGLVRNVNFDRQTLQLRFDITDGAASFPVRYQGNVTDLFKENQGVVVRGRFENNIFYATELIVKHSEEYNVPKNQSELKDLLKKASNE